MQGDYNYESKFSKCAYRMEAEGFHTPQHQPNHPPGAQGSRAGSGAAKMAQGTWVRGHLGACTSWKPSPWWVLWFPPLGAEPFRAGEGETGMTQAKGHSSGKGDMSTESVGWDDRRQERWRLGWGLGNGGWWGGPQVPLLCPSPRFPEWRAGI